jgi:ABC-type sugar transport system, permease component
MSPENVNNYYGMIYDGGGAGNYAALHFGNLGFSQYYEALLVTPQYWYNFWNSVYLTLPIMLGTVFIGSLGGYGFAKFDFPGKNILFFVFIIVMMMPYQITLIPNFMVANFLGLLGSRWSLILPNIFSAFGTYLVYQFMRSIPDETIEIASIEGAGNFAVLVKIVIPQAVPGIASLAILS